MILKIPIFLVICAVLVAALVSCRGESAPPVPTTVNEIYETYETNEAKGNIEFKDRPLDLTFKVDEIDGAKFVVHRLGNGDEAQLEFDQIALAQMVVGQTWHADCRLKGRERRWKLLGDYALRFDCRS